MHPESKSCSTYLFVCFVTYRMSESGIASHLGSSLTIIEYDSHRTSQCCCTL